MNLVTGRNNVGKTALLEALFIHSGAANIHLPFTIEALRGVTQGEASPDLGLAGLFNNFDTSPLIELEGIDKIGIKRVCTLKVIPVSTTLEPTAEGGGSVARGQGVEITFIDISSQQHVSSRAAFEKGELRLDPLPIPPTYVGVIVSAKGHSHKADAERFSELVKNKDEEEKLVDAIRVIEPSVRALRLLTHGGMAMIHVDVGLRRFLPLAYAGEGMARLASILVAVASSKNGVVFIDEFENGIHYTVLPKMWTAVAEFAERFNAQVFATTHSAECVRAAHQAFSGRDYTFRLFRLDRSSDGDIRAMTFGKDAVEAALKTDLELR